MRVFIAIKMDHDFDSYVNNLMCKSGSVVLESYHITLRFLDDIPDEQVEVIKNSLNKVKFDRFAIELGRIGFFPNDKFPRVVWIGLKNDSKMIELKRKIDDILNLELETNFKPHITVARLKQGNVNTYENLEVEPKKMIVSSFCLINSVLTREGAIHEIVEEYYLE